MSRVITNLLIVTLSFLIIYSNYLSLCSREGRAKEEEGASNETTQPLKCKLWCPRLDRPVRGTDDRTYDNYCELKRSICEGNEAQLDSLATYNRLICDENCYTVKVPVCGTNNKTYVNRCELHKAMVCAGEDVEMTYENECRLGGGQCDLQCPYRERLLVCGTNGKTYRHPCRIDKLKCHGRQVDVAYEGPCRPAPGEEPLDDYY